jgi:AcrR family transcriptional regulator
MRRLAAELDVGPMSLYRHVANKDDLIEQLADRAFGEAILPEPGPDGWRARLELVARQQWELCRRHLWLPRVISFTRPLLAPNAMAYTEWTLRALDGLGLTREVMVRETIALAATVSAFALALAAETEAGQETGVTLDRWWVSRERRTAELLDSGRFPFLASTSEEFLYDLDGLFEYGLARHLDGLAQLVDFHN